MTCRAELVRVPCRQCGYFGPGYWYFITIQYHPAAEGNCCPPEQVQFCSQRCISHWVYGRPPELHYAQEGRTDG